MNYVYLNTIITRAITTLSVIFCGLFLIAGLVVQGQTEDVNQPIQNQLVKETVYHQKYANKRK